MEKPRAFITGITGQDGVYLSKLLLEKGYEVYGVSSKEPSIQPSVTEYRVLDIRDHERLSEYLAEVHPQECYHLAALHRSSSATASQVEERASIETNVVPVHTLLSTLKAVNPDCRVFLAGSCHMFGEATQTPQNEQTPFAPKNIYAVTKAAATLLGRLYRDQHKMFVCTGILFNHDSPLRSTDFVTARIAKAAADISKGRSGELVLGNLDARVDWGFAGDYVQAMHTMLSNSQAEDFVIATGELHKVGDFVQLAFERVGLDWRPYVKEDAAAYRPVSKAVYQGDVTAIHTRLGWRPQTTFSELVNMMVDHYLDI